MPYDASKDPYLDKSTGILANLLNSKTQKSLDVSEAEITTVIIATLTIHEPPTIKDFNKRLLQDLHREIFGYIYKWAGEFRSIDISKGNSYFSHAAFISQSLDDLFNNLVQDRRIESKNKDEFVGRITFYYSELNAIHPFREGNGRTIRTFLRLLAINHGWDIEWARMTADENIAACAEAFGHEPKLMSSMLEKLIVKI